MFNQTKDIPFAAAMMGATYFLLRISRELPNAQWRHVVGFGLLLRRGARPARHGFAAGRLRRHRGFACGGVGAAQSPAGISRPLDATRAAGLRARLSDHDPVLAVGGALTVQSDPRHRVVRRHFHYQIRTIFADRIYDMAEVPWWYVPGYLAIKLPVVILGGVIVALPFLVLEHFPEKWTPVFRINATKQGICGRRISGAARSCLSHSLPRFPLACEMILEGPAFSACGIIHFLFRRSPCWRRSALTRLCAVCLSPSCAWVWPPQSHACSCGRAATLARLHPYEIMHYNFLVGGLQGASRQYVMDYWLTMLPEAMRDLSAYLDRIEAHEGTRRTYSVGICGEKFAFENYADTRMQYTKRMAGSRFLHFADQHGLRPSGQRQDHREHRALRRPDRHRQGPARLRAERTQSAALADDRDDAADRRSFCHLSEVRASAASEPLEG